MKSLEAFRKVDPGHAAPRLPRAIGWSSVGMGAAQLAAPAAIARVLGLAPGQRASTAARIMGAANLAIGTSLIVRPRRGSSMWARVAGDAIGLGLLAWAARDERASSRRVATAMAACGAVLALDAYAGRRLRRAHAESLVFAITINKPTREVYAFFRKLENLPRFMDYLESVEQRGAVQSHWVAKLPLRGTVEWDAEIVEERSGELIAWQTVEGSKFAHSGQVTFASAPGGTGTEVRVAMKIGLPGVAPSAGLANLLTRPQIKGDLRRLKQVMETGEVIISDASGVRGRHPAQPSSEATGRARAQARRLADPPAEPLPDPPAEPLPDPIDREVTP
jgi:uncharacterized membrane protein